MGRINAENRVFPFARDARNIEDLIAHELEILDSFPLERPKPRPGQVLRPRRLKKGVNYLDQNRRTVGIVRRPYRHEKLGLSVDIVRDSLFRETASLADLGIIPYGNGRWNPHNYLRTPPVKTS